MTSSAAAHVDTVVIAGPGLVGGSLALALRRAGFADRFLGYSHCPESLRSGVALGVIDDYTLDLGEAVECADLLVLATPTLVTESLLREILSGPLRSAGSGKVFTDVASVKGNLWRTAVSANGGCMPANVILGHPIAGSERSGVAAADAGLFIDHRVILTPVEGNDDAAVATVRAMWECTGAEVLELAVGDHDDILAATSHLPHMLAYALVDALSANDNSREILRFAAGGFRDFTRIASSDPVMWRDIAIANRAAILQAIDGFRRHLDELRHAIDEGASEDLLQTFMRAKVVRDEFTSGLLGSDRARSNAAGVE